MRVTLLTLGTRGDVEPYIALAIGLQRAGHDVVLGTSSDFEEMVTSFGVGFVPFRFRIREMLQSQETRSAFVSKRAAFRLARKVAPTMPLLLDDALTASQNAQVLIYHPKILNGLDISERLRIPCFIGFYLPITPTRMFPAPFLPVPAGWGGSFNRASHLIFLRIMTAPYWRLTNRWRKANGLAARPFWAEVRQRFGKGVPKLYAYSRHILPFPPDWDDSAHVTGQWFLDHAHSWSPPNDLLQYLGAGSPPVMVGFGSIAGLDPRRTTDIVVEALRLAGERGLLVGGWGGLERSTAKERVHFVDAVRYDWLLPRVKAVVHHGGAGSTGAGLRAGKPTVVCPFFGDQPFWGRRVYELGAGPLPVPQKRLSAKVLAQAIHDAVRKEDIRKHATALGERIRAENGVAAAVAIISETLAQRHSRTFSA